MTNTRTHLLLVIFAMLAFGAMVSAEDSQNITLKITFPEEGGVIYGDVIGSPASINVEITSFFAINEVIISNGKNQSSCNYVRGNQYLCSDPWHEGSRNVTVTVVDILGDYKSINRTYTLFAGQLPPPVINSTSPTPQSSGFENYMSITGLIAGLFLVSIKNW